MDPLSDDSCSLKSLQSCSLHAVAKMLCRLNNCDIPSDFPWLASELNPFAGIPYVVVEEIFGEFKKKVVAQKMVRKELLQIVLRRQTKRFFLSRLPVGDGVIVDLLKTWPSLTHLDVSGVCDDEVLEAVGVGCPNLIFLDASSGNFTSRGLKMLCGCGKEQPEGHEMRRCQKLQKIHLYRPKCDTSLEEGVEALLLHLPELRVLRCNPAYIERALVHLYLVDSKQLPKFNLREFIYRSSRLSDCPLVFAVVDTCPFLSVLDLCCTSNDELQRFACLRTLRTICVTKRGAVTFRDGVAPFLRKIGHSLRDLILDCFDELDYSDVSDRCPNLTVFKCTEFGAVTGRASSSSRPVFPRLTGLSLYTSSGRGMSPTDCVHLLSCCFNLQNVFVNCCHDLSRSDLGRILKANPLTELKTAEISSARVGVRGTCDDLKCTTVVDASAANHD